MIYKAKQANVSISIWDDSIPGFTETNIIVGDFDVDNPKHVLVSGHTFNNLPLIDYQSCLAILDAQQKEAEDKGYNV